MKNKGLLNKNTSFHHCWKMERDVERHWETLRDAERWRETLRDVERRWEMLRNIERCWEMLKGRWETLRDAERWPAFYGLHFKDAVEWVCLAFCLVCSVWFSVALPPASDGWIPVTVFIMLQRPPASVCFTAAWRIKGRFSVHVSVFVTGLVSGLGHNVAVVYFLPDLSSSLHPNVTLYTF